MNKMSWDEWKKELQWELGTLFGGGGELYVEQAGDECWRKMYDDGLTPQEAARKEVRNRNL